MQIPQLQFELKRDLNWSLFTFMMVRMVMVVMMMEIVVRMGKTKTSVDFDRLLPASVQGCGAQTLQSALSLFDDILAFALPLASSSAFDSRSHTWQPRNPISNWLLSKEETYLYF